jgi:hypothetical protein
LKLKADTGQDQSDESEELEILRTLRAMVSKMVERARKEKNPEYINQIRSLIRIIQNVTNLHLHKKSKALESLGQIEDGDFFQEYLQDILPLSLTLDFGVSKEEDLVVCSSPSSTYELLCFDLARFTSWGHLHSSDAQE